MKSTLFSTVVKCNHFNRTTTDACFVWRRLTSTGVTCLHLHQSVILLIIRPQLLLHQVRDTTCSATRCSLQTGSLIALALPSLVPSIRNCKKGFRSNHHTHAASYQGLCVSNLPSLCTAPRPVTKGLWGKAVREEE